MGDVVERIHPCPTAVELEAIAEVEVTAWAFWWQSAKEAQSEACADARAAARHAAEQALRSYPFRCKEPCGELIASPNEVKFDPARATAGGALGVDRVKCIATAHVVQKRECVMK